MTDGKKTQGRHAKATEALVYGQAVRRVGEKLGRDRDEIVGKLMRLYLWAWKAAPDGFIEGEPAIVSRELESVMLWGGRKGRLYGALVVEDIFRELSPGALLEPSQTPVQTLGTYLAGFWEAYGKALEENAKEAQKKRAKRLSKRVNDPDSHDFDSKRPPDSPPDSRGDRPPDSRRDSPPDRPGFVPPPDKDQDQDREEEEMRRAAAAAAYEASSSDPADFESPPPPPTAATENSKRSVAASRQKREEEDRKDFAFFQHIRAERGLTPEKAPKGLATWLQGVRKAPGLIAVLLAYPAFLEASARDAFKKWGREAPFAGFMSADVYGQRLPDERELTAGRCDTCERDFPLGRVIPTHAGLACWRCWRDATLEPDNVVPIGVRH